MLALSKQEKKSINNLFSTKQFYFIIQVLRAFQKAPHQPFVSVSSKNTEILGGEKEAIKSAFRHTDTEYKLVSQ